MTPAADRGAARVVLAAGGTAGHLEPALATARALTRRTPPTSVTFLGTAKGLETTLVPARGYDLRLVPAVPMPRGATAGWLTLVPRLSRATRAAATVLRDVRADAVVGFGGYASLPAYLAARRLGVAIVLHEANAKAGVANRVGARLTRHVAVSTSGTGLPHATLVGVPLREEITELDREASRSVARKELGLDHERPTLLVFGGSQGARRLNDAAVAAAPQLAAAGVQVLHAAGPGNTVELPPRADTDPPYVVVPYLEHIERAYAAADLALCRSGAMSCAELAAVGLPAVFVPYPFSNQEQRLNAAPMVQRGGALLVDDADLTGDWVVEHVLPLVTDPEALRTMSERAQGVGGDDAVARLVAMVDDALGER